MTRAMDPEVADAIWAAIEPILPVPDDDHPLGCHNPRGPDQVCFRGILIRLVTGSSWTDIEAIMKSTAGDMGEKATELRAKLAHALEKAQAAAGRVEDKAIAGAKAADKVIRNHPYESIGVAFGIGILIGVLITRK